MTLRIPHAHCPMMARTQAVDPAGDWIWSGSCFPNFIGSLSAWRPYLVYS